MILCVNEIYDSHISTMRIFAANFTPRQRAMTSDTTLLGSLPDIKPVRVFLPITGKKERYRASCVLEKSTSTEFNLLFKPGTLPTHALDITNTCLINVDMGGPNMSIEARIKRIEGEQMLKMVLEKSISHEQMREFFRVDATTSVISSSFHPEFFDKEGEPWSIKGKTVDISGSGILATFTEAPPEDKQVRLEITLPMSESGVISILAHPVRTQQVSEDLYEVAYHFDDISTEDRDRIIGCCLILQRKLLRLKVQVKGSANL